MIFSVVFKCKQDTSTKATFFYIPLTSLPYFLLGMSFIQLLVPESLQNETMEVADSSHFIQFLKSIISSRNNFDQV